MDDRFGGAKGWCPVPTVLVGSTPAGAVEESFFLEFLEELRDGLVAAGSLDGVYVCQHGAAIATHTHDPDGDMFRLIREMVGSDVPVVATLDLHANVSEEMVADPKISKNIESAIAYVGGRCETLFSGVYVRKNVPGLIAILSMNGLAT